jgi:site-specific recombinase XerD
VRNPNGYGTVYKLTGNRRNPFIAKKTKGYTVIGEKRQPVYETIGYYPTREAAMIALAEFNKNPYDIDQSNITFKELFELWETKKAPKLGASNQGALRSAFKHCSKLSKMKYKEIKLYHMQSCIDDCGWGHSVQCTIKNLFYHVERFAVELDIPTLRYSELLTCVPANETSKQPFTNDEVAALWKISNEPWVDSVLVFLYTGFRVTELLNIKSSDVDLEHWIIKGGIKSKAGKDRIVPIHSKILTLIEARLQDDGEYLFMRHGKKLYKELYYPHWYKVMESISTDNKVGGLHTVHETRHTFRTRLDSAGANKKCIDLIMGHKSNDVGERIYTHKTIQELHTAIELIKD